MALPPTRLVHVVDNVYAYPGDMRRVRPWIGVVVTDEGTLLIDSGNGTSHAREIRDEIDALGARPVSHILLTHHHWDHVFGSCLFPGARIIAHELTQPHLLVMADEPWSDGYLAEKIARGGREAIIAGFMDEAVPNWERFSICPATETFRDTFELTLGGNQITMTHVGGQHEPDQVIVHARPADVLFLGDATYGHAASDHWDLPALIADHERFLATGAAHFVEGHRAPAPRHRFEARVERLRRRASEG